MSIDKSLDKLDDMLEEAWNLPLMSGKRMVDFKRMRDALDDIRLNLPREIKESKLIINDRDQILKDARAEAEDIIKRAEQKARQLISQEEVLKEAQSRASALLTDAQTRSKEMERASLDFAENSLKKSEDAMLLGLNEVKSARMALRSKPGRSSSGATTKNNNNK